MQLDINNDGSILFLQIFPFISFQPFSSKSFI